MRVIIAVIAVGVMILGFGWLYTMYDDILGDFFNGYIYDTDDVYYLGTQLVWDAWPYAVLLCSLLLLYYIGRQYGTNSGGGTG